MQDMCVGEGFSNLSSLLSCVLAEFFPPWTAEQCGKLGG